MKPVVKNILAFIVGLVIGNVANMGLVTVGHSVFPIEGVDPNNMEALAAIMPTLGGEHFIFPFLAHALGTLLGAIVTAKIAASNKMKLALGIGCFFLLAGIAINIMLPGPIWFAVLDIAVAYIPMAYVGGKIGMKLSK